MSNSAIRFIPFFFTKKGISAFFIVTILTYILFVHRALPFQWLIFGVLGVLIFFYVSPQLSIRWNNLSIPVFSKKLFRTSLAIRLVWVLFSYFYYIWATGKPFEFYTADAFGYHGEGQWLAGLMHDGKFDQYLVYIGKNYSDMGYPFYLGILYYIIGDNVFIARFIKAILGAYTCLFIYKLARNNFGESTGRMAGIMAMLLPNLIYYCGLHVKETEMVFLTVWFVYLGDKLIRARKIQARDVFWLALTGASLFFFRTVLATCLLGSLALATLFTSTRVSRMGKRTGLILLLGLGVYIIASTSISQAIDGYLKTSDQNLSSQMKNFSTRQDGSNRLAQYGSRGIFLPIMLMAPFPTLVNIPDQPNAMMLGGAIFTRNVYAFFVLVALITLYKRKLLRAHLLLLSVIFSYIFVLASSGFALSERFHLPLVPFLLTLAAYGISQMNQKNKKYYVPYLVLISAIVIGWNWFKIAGRS